MQENIELMENAPVKRAILFLALPSVLAMMVQVIYGLTDTFFISQLNDPNLVAAVSLIMPFALLIQAVGNIFAIGGASFISRMLGEKNILEAKRTCSTAFYCSVLLGLFITVVAYASKNYILKLLGTSPATWEATQTYMVILVLSSIIQILQIVLSGLIRSEGATKQAMLGILIGTSTNMVLDYVFILLLNWGIAGAAWATALGNLCGTIYYLLYFKNSKTLLSLNGEFFKPDKEMMINILSIGFPAALNAFIMSVSHIISNHIAISYGENVMAANGIMLRLGAISFLSIMGIAQGYQPFAGYNFGAKHFARLNAAFIFSTGLATGIGLVMGFIFYFFGEGLLGLFMQNQEVIEKGFIMMRAFVWSMPLFGIHFMISMTFQATGKALLAFILVLVRQIVFFLPLLFILNSLYGFQGFIFTQPIADAVTSVIAAGLLFVFLKRLPQKSIK